MPYLIFAKGEFFDDAGWPYEEKFFNRVLRTREDAERVIEEMYAQKDMEFDDPDFNRDYDDFFDPDMDRAEFEIIKIDPEDTNQGGVFYNRTEEELGELEED